MAHSMSEILLSQTKLEERVTRKMDELAAQLQSGGSSKETVARVADELRTFREIVFHIFSIQRQQIAEGARNQDVMETRLRRNALLCLGFTETDKEDCASTVLDVVHKKMALTNISVSSISRCHRIGTRDKDRNRPILVWFDSTKDRSDVWKARSKLKGTSLVVKEFLTKTRQAVYSGAREHFGIKSTWTQDGIIVVKASDETRHKITTLDELKNLTAKYPKAAGETSSGARSGAGSAGTASASFKSRRN